MTFAQMELAFPSLAAKMAYAFVRGRRYLERNDALQESRMALCLLAQRCVEPPSEGYVVASIRHHLIDWERKQRRHNIHRCSEYEMSQIPSKTPSPQISLEAAEMIAKIERLPDPLKAVAKLRLMVLPSRTFEDIGKQLNMLSAII